jgi:hypothetical protein
MVCEKVFGEKEALYDKRSTHGFCDPYFEEFRVKYENRGAVKQKPQNRQMMQININAQTI